MRMYIILLSILIYLIVKAFKSLDIDTLKLGVANKQWRTNDLKRIQARGELPQFYPNTWLAVCESYQLQSNEIKVSFAFGKDIVIYRGMSGQSYVCDAYCPHSGANLGIGGFVKGESIRCPCHGRIFNNEGLCEHLPGFEDHALPKEKLNAWNSVEMNGFIYVWHHSNGDKTDWYPTQLTEDKNRMIYRNEINLIINSHILEIVENTADYTHTTIVHRPPFVLGIILETPKHLMALMDLINNEMSFKWKPSKSEPHKCLLDVEFKYQIFGKTLAVITAKYEADGPGISHMKIVFNTPFGKEIIMIINSIIQLGPMKQNFVTKIYSTNGFISLFINKLFHTDHAIQALRDVMIWNNKRYLSQPFFSKLEKSMVEYRHWLRQFSTEKAKVIQKY